MKYFNKGEELHSFQRLDESTSEYEKGEFYVGAKRDKQYFILGGRNVAWTYTEMDILHDDEPIEEAKDAINPMHYRQGIETYDYIQSWDMNFTQGNVVKYVSRYNFKSGLEDLLKAQWYLNKLIEEEKSK